MKVRVRVRKNGGDDKSQHVGKARMDESRNE